LQTPSPLLPEERLLLLRQLRALRARQQLLRRDFGLSFYRPHEKQDSFHRAGAFKHRLWESGNRGGKSTAGVAEDAAWLVGERVWYPTTDPARYAGIPKHPRKGIVVTADWDKVDEIFTSERGTEGKLWQFLPRGYVKSKRTNHSGVVELIECIDGSTLRFDTVKSWKVNPMGLESSDHDFAHFDEPAPQQMYIAISRGLIDRNGKDWFNLTPITERWIHDMFFPDPRSKKEIVFEGNKWAQRSTTYDNPYLTQEAIADYVASLTQEERECRILGIPLTLSGLVYKEFNWDTHVLTELPVGWRAFNDPPLDYTIYVAIDPHPQTPHHVLFLAVAPTGEWFVFDELYIHCTIEELSGKIRARLEAEHTVDGKKQMVARWSPRIICDPYAFNTFPVQGTHGKHISMADEFSSAGVFISKASKALEQGILAVKRALKTENLVHLSPYLEETLFEFGHYAWDTKENRPKDERDHAMENFYRLVLEQPKHIPKHSTKFVMPELVIDRPSLDLPPLDLSLD
jgi:hypothetical protein